MMKTREKKSREKDNKRVNKSVAQKAGSVRVGKGAGALRKEADFRVTFMENILLKKMELEEILARLIGSQKEYDSQQSGGDFIEEFDRAQREISASSYYPIIERKIKELKKIETLINRISKDENFGLCEECGKKIPNERLLIVPEASLCVSCQRELEKVDLYKSLGVRTSAGAGTGRGKETEWEEGDDSETSSYMILRTHTDTFSLNDIQETEPENDFAAKEKEH